MTALYNKYRPQRFEDILGNKALVRIMQTKLRKGTFPNVALFTGAPGNGKTTAARILALALTCHNPDPETGNPCLECTSCRQSQSGDGNLDLQESNMAEENKADYAEALIEKMRYRPANGKKKVYILDECHCMTDRSQSLLLKNFEDIPDYLSIMLVTSNPLKMQEAIHSRAVGFRLHPPSEDAKIACLKNIAKAEDIDITEASLRLIIQKSNGMRDTIQLFELLLDLGDLSPQAIKAYFNEPDDEHIYTMITGLASADIDLVLEANKKLSEFAVDDIFTALVDNLRAILEAKCRLNYGQISGLTGTLAKLEQGYSYSSLQSHFKILMQYQRMPPMSDKFKKQWLEALLISLCFKADFSLEGLV